MDSYPIWEQDFIITLFFFWRGRKVLEKLVYFVKPNRKINIKDLT